MSPRWRNCSTSRPRRPSWWSDIASAARLRSILLPRGRIWSPSLVLLDPAVGLDGAWMRDIADDMFASPDYADREEARAEKASGSWGDVDAAELERELDEHLIELPSGRCGWRISIPAMMSYWSELARPIIVAAQRDTDDCGARHPYRPALCQRRAHLGAARSAWSPLHAGGFRLRSHGGPGAARRHRGSDPQATGTATSDGRGHRRAGRSRARSRRLDPRRAGCRHTAISPMRQVFPARASSAGSCEPIRRTCRGIG